VVDEAHEQVVVAASPSMCFGIAADFEEYPAWAPEVKRVDVVARDATGRATRVEYRAAALGRTIRYVLDYDFADAPSSFSWSLVDGDMLRQLDGRYSFAPHETGTLVTYDLGVDLAVPLPGPVRRRAASMIVGNALQGLKRTAEGVS
jgi:ribosome-associated toxin RatA of RatAB toxin-antitoxin module